MGVEWNERTELTRGPEETEAVAAELAGGLVAGDVILISGTLGAGKTTFVRGACRALGIGGPVSSPTFTIGRLHPRADGPDVAHLDLYRLGSLADEEPGLLDDYLNPATIAFVEWPSVADGAAGEEAGLTDARAEVEIAHAGRDERRVIVRERARG